MKKVYYNDNDKDACAWLRQLIADGLIPDGDVDERSILDVKPEELAGYEQLHFFAGIGGWAYSGERAMRSTRKSRQSSSEPSSKP